MTVIENKHGRKILSMNFPYRKKVGLGIYDNHTNSYIKVATFNNDTAAEEFMEYLAKFVGAKKDDTELLDEQPTIEAKRQTGHWFVDGEFIDCSNCKKQKWSKTPYESLVRGFRYCPNCGARMEES